MHKISQLTPKWKSWCSIFSHVLNFFSFFFFFPFLGFSSKSSATAYTFSTDLFLLDNHLLLRDEHWFAFSLWATFKKKVFFWWMQFPVKIITYLLEKSLQMHLNQSLYFYEFEFSSLSLHTWLQCSFIHCYFGQILCKEESECWWDCLGGWWHSEWPHDSDPLQVCVKLMHISFGFSSSCFCCTKPLG